MAKTFFSSHNVVCIKERRGVINPEGYTIVPVAYGNVEIKEEYKVVEVSDGPGTYGAYNFAGKLIVPMRYMYLSYATNYILGIRESCGKDLYDYDGNFILTLFGNDIYTAFNLILNKGYDCIEVYNSCGELFARLNGEEGKDFDVASGIIIDEHNSTFELYDKEGQKIEVEDFEKIIVQEEFIAGMKNGNWNILYQY